MPPACRRHRRPVQLRERAACASWLPWALWGSLLLAPAWGYVIVSSVSWPVPREVEDDLLDSSSNEEVLPALLEDAGSLWKRSSPAGVYKAAEGEEEEEEEEGQGVVVVEEEEVGDLRSRPGATGRAKPQVSSPSRMFSYRREGVKGTDSLGSQVERASRTARALAHRNLWGFVATTSAQEKIQGTPFGNYLSFSDGPTDNSTGIPFFYVTPKDNTVADLMQNPTASLTLLEVEGDFCRKATVDPDDPRCARLTLVGQMVPVPPEEIEFAKQALFSRHSVMRKWPRSYEWFFMKMNIEHVWLKNWYGGIVTVALEEYFKATHNKA